MENDIEAKSKTQIKKEMHELQELGKKLVDLSDDQLRRTDMPDKLKEAVASAKKMSKHGALSRQLHYIGSIMRDVDPEPIRQALESDDESRVKNVRLFKMAELWRDRLIDGDNSVFDEIFEHYPKADSQHLRQLMRNAQKEKAAEKPPKSSRALFRALKTLIDEEAN